MKPTIFTAKDIEKANLIMQNPHSKLSSLANFEIQELATVWCYYSGKIEGNTYTLVETEALLKDNITSEKRYSDAKMLKNLYNTFISVLEMVKKDGAINIDKRFVTMVHSSITDELLPVQQRGIFREHRVSIQGANYEPKNNLDEIKEEFDTILKTQYQYKNPLERAIYLHCNMAKLQAFSDGNKRTSRILESAVLMNADIIPVSSCKDSDILNYRRALVHFYETGEYRPYVDFFLKRQIEQIVKESLNRENLEKEQERNTKQNTSKI